jgi:hypothetical protein
MLEGNGDHTVTHYFLLKQQKGIGIVSAHASKLARWTYRRPGEGKYYIWFLNVLFVFWPSFFTEKYCYLMLRWKGEKGSRRKIANFPIKNILTSGRRKVQYIFAKTNLYFCESAVHQIRPEKNSKTFKIIFRMRQKLTTARTKFLPVETMRNNDGALSCLTIETTFWNYSCLYRHLHGSECNLEKHAHEWVFQRRSKLHESEERVQFEVFEKLTSLCFFQIAWETILLLFE